MVGYHTRNGTIFYAPQFTLNPWVDGYGLLREILLCRFCVFLFSFFLCIILFAFFIFIAVREERIKFHLGVAYDNNNIIFVFHFNTKLFTFYWVILLIAEWFPILGPKLCPFHNMEMGAILTNRSKMYGSKLKAFYICKI